MIGTYDIWLVSLSIAVAVIASYVALDLAARLAASTGNKAAPYWLIGGAAAMGTGIWSMHFIGMLAFRLPIPISYDIAITLLSLLIAVLVSGLALHTISRGNLSARRLAGAGLLMGTAIASMHYTGMAAMRMRPPVNHDLFLVILSILIAMSAAVAALWIALQPRSETGLSAFWKKAGGALVMGAAISGMHYTGMAAAIFAPDTVSLVNPEDINNVWLARAIGGFTFMFLAANLLASAFDAYLAETLRASNAALEKRAGELSRINVLLEQKISESIQTEGALRDSEERYRQLVELSPDGIFIQSESRIAFVNGACMKLLGAATREELIGKPVLEIVHPDFRKTVIERIRRLGDENPTVLPLEAKVLRLDGAAIDVEVTASPFMYRSNPGVQVVMRDITERKRAEEEIRKTQTFLSSIVDNLPSMVSVKDAKELRFMRLNKAGEAMTGFSEQELLGKNDYDLFPKEQADFFVAKDRETLDTGKLVFVEEEPIRTKDGAERILQTKKLPVFDGIGNIQYVLGISEDITERKKAEERLAYLAQYDSLTGLPNRSLFRDRLTQAMVRAKRNDRILALMFLDLDHFKEINDSLGHSTGDEVLQAVAGRLRASLRLVDTIARLGGDEFTIILENIARPDDVTMVAQKIWSAFSDPLVIQGREIFVTASIGITLYPRDVEDIDALLQTADIAMYHAKEEGRNTYEFYAAEMHDHAAERLNMEALLRRALERQEFLLHYQPKVTVHGGRIVGMEALIRWNSKELGVVSPAKFIPLAEKTGLIVPIGEWVLKVACAQNKAWQARGLPALLMSVNLSARQFQQKNLVEMIVGAIEATGLGARFLELEITESMIMHRPEKAIAVLQQLHDIGVQLSVDDFGTGYSSLAYLKRFPVQKLKIDQSFVRDITTDAEDAAIVGAVVAMAKSLELNVIAEGVETPEQLAFLAKLDCDEYQGYLFSRPLPADEIERSLEKNQTNP